MKGKVIKILIVDDHALIRQGLKSIISFEEDLIVIAEAENGEKALELIKQHHPDIMLLDINMPQLNGMKLLEYIRAASIEIKIIMLTMENQSQTIHEAINQGVDGYVLKDSAGEEIIDAIRTVYSGEKYIDKSLVSTLFMNIKGRNKVKSVLDALSKREAEVLVKISKGYSNKMIGEQLYLSEKTIKNYVTNVFLKINAHDRVGATIIALENQIEAYYRSKFGEDE
jgi:two-component system response regulator DegU